MSFNEGSGTSEDIVCDFFWMCELNFRPISRINGRQLYKYNINIILVKERFELITSKAGNVISSIFSKYHVDESSLEGIGRLLLP